MDTAPASVLNRMMANSDVLVSVGVICVVMMMIIPIPKQVLDIFLTFNIGFCSGHTPWCQCLFRVLLEFSVFSIALC